MTTAQAYERLVENEVASAPVLSHPQVLEDPQITHNGTIMEATHPVYGRYRRARPAVHFSGTPTADTSAPALYGDHTDEILGELGMSAERVAALRERNVVK